MAISPTWAPPPLLTSLGTFRRRIQRKPRVRHQQSCRSCSITLCSSATSSSASAPTSRTDAPEGVSFRSNDSLHSSTIDETLLTPMMRHYVLTKRVHSSHVLLYRVGDFFESFLEDAVTFSSLCGITLTSKEAGRRLGSRVPMAGVPHHALEPKLRTLLAAGRSVAIVDQLPTAPLQDGLMQRRVSRILTPGTLDDPALIPARSATYLMAVHCSGGSTRSFSVAIADVASGEFRATEIQTHSDLSSLLAQTRPAEVLVTGTGAEDILPPSCRSVPRIASEKAERLTAWASGVDSTEALGLRGRSGVVQAAALLLQYLSSVDPAAKLDRLNFFDSATDSLILDESCLRNLEVVRTMRDGDASRSLCNLADQSITSMGARKAKTWIVAPLRDLDKIKLRHSIVEALLHAPMTRDGIRSALRTVPDLQRLAGRVAAARSSPRELRVLVEGVLACPAIVEAAQQCFLAANKHIMTASDSEFCSTEQMAPSEHLVTPSAELVRAAQNALTALTDPAPATLPRDAFASATATADWGAISQRVFRKGFNDELDAMVVAVEDPSGWAGELEAREQERSGLQGLRVKRLRGTGWVVRVPRTAGERALDENPRIFAELGYERTQSTKAELRFRTRELSNMEAAHAGAVNAMLRKEAELFEELRAHIAVFAMHIRKVADGLAALDVLTGFAHVASEQRYVRPEMLPASARHLEIIDGRHPVVEENLPPGESFVPNSFCLGSNSNMQEEAPFPDEVILCGPNAAGKSVAIRSVGVAIILAQAGSFVPASSAKISITDRLLTRVGAVDDVGAGQSTFQVEMSETSAILRSATPHSVVLLDEIGRGTAVADGIAIAWAVAHALATRSPKPPRTLFVTHYHELNELAAMLPNVHACRMQLALGSEGTLPTPTHRILPGPAWESLGIAVARRAGFPKDVLDTAEKVIAALRMPSRALATALRKGLCDNPDALDPQEEESEYQKGVRDGYSKLRAELRACLPALADALAPEP